LERIFNRKVMEITRMDDVIEFDTRRVKENQTQSGMILAGA
jgi:hypothetical protein